MTEAIAVTDEAPKKRRRRRRKKRLPSDVSVHLATPDDVQDLVDMIVESHKDPVFDQFGPVDEKSLEEFFGHAVAAGCVLIARRSMGRAIGMIGIIVTPLFYNPSYRAACTFSWWVHPLDRTSGVGAELIRRAEVLAREFGARGLAVVTRADSPAAAQRVRNLGYVPKEANYYKEL